MRLRYSLLALHKDFLSTWVPLEWNHLSTATLLKRILNHTSRKKKINDTKRKCVARSFLFLYVFLYSEQHRSEIAMAQDVLFGSRDNVNLVVELYRQGFLLPLQHSPSIRKILSLYRDWIHRKVVEVSLLPSN